MRTTLFAAPLLLACCGGGDGSDFPVNFGAPVVGYEAFVWPCDSFVAFGFYDESPNESAGWYVDEGGVPRFWSGGPFHRGIDLVAFTSDHSVFAAAPGTAHVYPASDGHPYGNRVVVDHGNAYHTLYAHLSLFSVADGQAVAAGERLGVMGLTGQAGGGVHLHFEVRHEPSGSVSNWQRHCPGVKFERVSKGDPIGGYFPIHGN